MAGSPSSVSFESPSLTNRQDHLLPSTGGNYSSGIMSDSTIATSCFPHTSLGDTMLCPVTVMTSSINDETVRKNLLPENIEDKSFNVTGNNKSHLVNRNTQFDGFNDSQSTTCSHNDACLGTSLATTAASLLNNDVNLQEGINETVVQPPVTSDIPYSDSLKSNTSMVCSNEILIIDQTAQLHPGQELQLSELEIGVNDDHTESTEIVIQDTDDVILTRNPTISFMLNNKPIREILNTLENDHVEDGLKQTVPNEIQSQVNSDGIHSFMLTDSKINKDTNTLRQRSKTEFELETTSLGLNDFKTCLCTDLENRQEVPEDQMFIVQGQMYRLDTAVIVKIGHLQMHAFVRDDSLFIPKCLLFKFIDGHSERVFRHALRKKSIMQEMSTKEMLENDCELIRQKYNINTNCSSRLMIDLTSLRKISRLQTEMPSGISVLAYDDYMIKVKNANTRCSFCGSRIFNSTVKDEFDIIDLELLEANSKDSITNQLVPVSIGVLAIHKTKLPSFQMKSVTYICMKDLVHLNVLSLQYLKTKLTELKYRPICAPPEVISNLKELNFINYNSLWIDINRVVNICESFEGKAEHFLQQKFIEKSLCFETRAEVLASDTSESENKFVLSNKTCLIIEKADHDWACEDSFFIGKNKRNKGISSQMSVPSSKFCGGKSKGRSRSRPKQKRSRIMLEFGAEYIVKDIEELKAAVSESVVHISKNGVECAVQFSDLFDKTSEMGTDKQEIEMKVGDMIKERSPVKEETLMNRSIGNQDPCQGLDQSRQKTNPSNQEIPICFDQTLKELTGIACEKADTSSHTFATPPYSDQTLVETPNEIAHTFNLTPRKQDFVCQNINQYLNWTSEKTDIDHEASLSSPNQITEISSHQENKTIDEGNKVIQDDIDFLNQTPVKKNRGKHDSHRCIDQNLEEGESIHHGETKLRSCKLSLGSKKGGTRLNSRIEKSRRVEMKEDYLSTHNSFFAQGNSIDIFSEKRNISSPRMEEDSQSQEKKIGAIVTQDVEGKQKQLKLNEVYVSIDGRRELFGSPVHASKSSNKFKSLQLQAHDSIDNTDFPLQSCKKNDDQLKSPTKLAFSIDKILSPEQTDEKGIELVSPSEPSLRNQVYHVTESPLHTPDQVTMSSPYHSPSSKAKMNKIANKINSRIAPMMSPDSNTELETNLSMLAFAAIASAEENLESEADSFDDAEDLMDYQISILQQNKSKEKKKEFEMKIKQFVEFRVQNGVIEVTRFLKGAEAAFPELFRPHPNHPESLQRQKLFKQKVCQWVMGFVSKKSAYNSHKKKVNTPRAHDSSKSEKKLNMDQKTKTDKCGQLEEEDKECHGISDPFENTQSYVSVNNKSNTERKSRSKSLTKITQNDFESNRKRRKLDIHLLSNSVGDTKRSTSRKRKFKKDTPVNDVPSNEESESNIITSDELKQRDNPSKKGKLDKLTNVHENKSEHVHENENMNNVIADGDSCSTNMNEARVSCYEIHYENEKYDKDFAMKNGSVPETMSTDKNKVKIVQSFHSEYNANSKQYRKGKKSHFTNCKSLIGQKPFYKKDNKKNNTKGSIKVCLKASLGEKRKKQVRQTQKLQMESLNNDTGVIQNKNLKTEKSLITKTTIIHNSLIDVVDSKSIDHTIFPCQNESLNFEANDPVTNGRDQESDVNSNRPNRSKKIVSRAKGKSRNSEKVIDSFEESNRVTENCFTENVILKPPVNCDTQLDIECVSPSDDKIIMPSRDNDILPLIDNGKPPWRNNNTLPGRDSDIMPCRGDVILPFRVQRKGTRSDRKSIEFEGSDKRSKESVVDSSSHQPVNSSLPTKQLADKDLETVLKWKALHEPSCVLLKRIPVIENSIAFRIRGRIS